MSRAKGIKDVPVGETTTTRCGETKMCSLLMRRQNGTATLEKSLAVFLPYAPIIALFGFYPKELKMYVHAKPCTGMFIAALFLFSKMWKQPKCLSVDEWINCSTSKQ